jgi:hypothetical protein
MIAAVRLGGGRKAAERGKKLKYHYYPKICPPTLLVASSSFSLVPCKVSWSPPLAPQGKHWLLPSLSSGRSTWHPCPGLGSELPQGRTSSVHYPPSSSPPPTPLWPSEHQESLMEFMLSESLEREEGSFKYILHSPESQGTSDRSPTWGPQAFIHNAAFFSCIPFTGNLLCARPCSGH